MNICKYAITDEARLIDLLRLNTPQYFSPIEEKDLLEYLNQHSSDHYVVEIDKAVVGCGGFTISENATEAKISWDFFHPDHQGKGHGAALIKFRIEKILQTATVKKITVRTSQFAYKFYAKFGFKLQEVIKDFWDEGYDLYRMELICT